MLVTMILFDYRLSEAWSAKERIEDLTAADELALRYQLLLGDIVLKIDVCDFSAKWEWIPIVDFIASLKHIISLLAKGDVNDATFEFTESNAAIHFKREGDDILITANYVPCKAYVPLEDLRTAVNAFARRVLEELCQKFPALRQNVSFRRLFEN